MTFHSKTYNFKVTHVAAINSESDESALRMPALHSCSSWVDVEKPKIAVGHNFENMRMPRNKQLRRISINLRSDGTIVMSRVAAYVFHQHLNLLAFPSKNFGKHKPKVAAVAVSAHSSNRAKGL